MRHWFFVLLLVFWAACGGKDDTLVKGGYDEAAMNAAIARARSEVDGFISTLEKRDGSGFGVKAPVQDKGETEHFWLTGVTYRDGEFEGKIGNDPGVVTNVEFGQTIRIKKEEISDWMFMRDGKLHGNYTLRPLLDRLDPDEAARYRALFAEP
jgi:uncharacterized protein YegJ (DUF2314 family)